MSYEAEFETVDLLLQCRAETAGVDAFVLSLIKAERQARRLLTHLVYQFPCFERRDVVPLRRALAANTRVYFEGFVSGFDAIYPLSMAQLMGPSHDRLYGRLRSAIEVRNKIFHGQLTSQHLTRPQLLAYVDDICTWCRTLATVCHAAFGYDGFERNSFRKRGGAVVSRRLRIQLTDVDSYRRFIEEFMVRSRPTRA